MKNFILAGIGQSRLVAAFLGIICAFTFQMNASWAASEITCRLFEDGKEVDHVNLLEKNREDKQISARIVRENDPEKHCTVEEFSGINAWTCESEIPPAFGYQISDQFGGTLLIQIGLLPTESPVSVHRQYTREGIIHTPLYKKGAHRVMGITFFRQYIRPQEGLRRLLWNWHFRDRYYKERVYHQEDVAEIPMPAIGEPYNLLSKDIHLKAQSYTGRYSAQCDSN